MASGQNSRWFILEGVLLIILGVVAVALPIAAGLAAALVIGWVLLLSGILGLVAVFRSRHLAHPGWSAASAIIALLAGLLILWDPFAGAITLTVLLGAYLLIDGVALIGLSFDQRKRSSRWGWMLASGILDLILAAVILLLPPAGATGLVGVIVGIDLIIAGIALIGLGMAGSNRGSAEAPV